MAGKLIIVPRSTNTKKDPKRFLLKSEPSCRPTPMPLSLKPPPFLFRRNCCSLNQRSLFPCIILSPSAIASGKFNASPPVIHRRLSSASAPPLRILFCGSDHFSVASLRALHQEHISNRSLIGSIDVLCLKDQRTGRSLRTIKESASIP